MDTFYDLSKFSTAKLRKFFRYCVYKSYSSHMENIPNGSWARKNCDEISIGNFINKLVTTKTINVFIHRNRTYENYIETGACTFSGENIFLYIYININELNEIVEKFNLIPLK